MKTQRLFFIVIGLCLLLCVGSAVIYGILMKDFVVWNSTLEEFRASAEKERKAFEEELSYKENTSNEIIQILESQSSTYQDKLSEIQNIIASYDSDLKKSTQLQAENNAMDNNISYLQGRYNDLSDSIKALEDDYSSLQTAYNDIYSQYNTTSAKVMY